MLVYDNRAAVGQNPGLHALIVGVSNYPRLPSFPEKTSLSGPPTYGMRQLTSTALSAYRMYEWLLSCRELLPVPLATIRFLASPSGVETEIEARLSGFGGAATLERFQESAIQWRDDAAQHPEGVTCFYFAGHGVERNKGDQVLLLEGFGSPNAAPLFHAVDTHTLRYGMAPSARRPNIARRQLYVVDACRMLPAEFQKIQTPIPTAVFDVPLPGIDDRRAPIFYAAVPGARAWAVNGEPTFFCTALLECLNGLGAREPDELLGASQWHISSHSLASALSDSLLRQEQRRLQMGGHPADRLNFQVDGAGEDFILTNLSGAPVVDVDLIIDPAGALPHARVTVIDDETGQPVRTFEPPLSPHPYRDRLQAGMYRVRADFAAPVAGYRSRERAFRLVPPRIPPMKVRVV